MPIPTQAPLGPDIDVLGAETSGILEGDTEVDGGCLWVKESDVDVLAVKWPNGYSAAFDPPGLLDPDGRVVATKGELVWLPGGFAPSDDMDRCTLGAGRVWTAHDAQPLAEGQEHPAHPRPALSGGRAPPARR